MRKCKSGSSWPGARRQDVHARSALRGRAERAPELSPAEAMSCFRTITAGRSTEWVVHASRVKRVVAMPEWAAPSSETSSTRPVDVGVGLKGRDGGRKHTSRKLGAQLDAREWGCAKEWCACQVGTGAWRWLRVRWHELGRAQGLQRESPSKCGGNPSTVSTDVADTWSMARVTVCIGRWLV